VAFEKEKNVSEAGEKEHCALQCSNEYMYKFSLYNEVLSSALQQRARVILTSVQFKTSLQIVVQGALQYVYNCHFEDIDEDQ
jgi:hypothetical protein